MGFVIALFAILSIVLLIVCVQYKGKIDYYLSQINNLQAIINQHKKVKQPEEPKIDKEKLLKEINQLKEEYDSANRRRISMVDSVDVIMDEYLAYEKKIEETEDYIVDLELKSAEQARVLTECAEKVLKMQSEISSLAAQHKEATKRLTEVSLGRFMEFSVYEKELEDTLEMLKAHYPQLADNFNQIIWTKIWQPKFQAMTVDLLKQDVCGIYRIFTINNDGFQLSYVGQAKKIRERWSQHIKKMIGVDKTDNAKFYSFVKPHIAHFEIIEPCKESELNAKERYWIDYYNCIENGYNSK